MADTCTFDNLEDLGYIKPTKTRKRGLVTGKTLRAVSTKRRARYISQPILIKSMTVGLSELDKDVADGYLFTSKDDFRLVWDLRIPHKNFVSVSNIGSTSVDEGGMHDHTVTYSLNKRKRWKLAGLLGENISQAAFQVGKDGVCDWQFNPQTPVGYDVTLVEHHKIQRRADCTSIFSTKFKDKYITPRNTHLDCKSALNSSENFISVEPKKGKRKEKKHCNNSEMEKSHGQFVPEKSEIRYDIYYPMPSIHSITYNKKLMVDREIRHPEDLAHPNSGKFNRNYRGNGKFSCKRERSWNNSYDVEAAEEDLEGDILDWSMSDIVNPQRTSNSEEGHTLYQFIQQTTNTPKSTKSGRKKKKKCHARPDDCLPTRKIIYLEQEEEEKKQALGKATCKKIEDRMPNAVAVEINMEKSNLQAQFLEGNYPQLYKMPNTLPPKILMDVTDIVKKTLSQKTTHKHYVNQLDLESYLLLETVQDCMEDKSTSFQRVQVSMLTNYNISQLKLETIQEDGDYNLEGLLTAVAKFAVILGSDPNRFKQKDVNKLSFSKLRDSTSAFGMIHRATRSRIKNGTADQVFKETSVYGKLEGKTQFDSAHDIFVEDWDVLCALCYELIDATNRGTALLPCQHWTCNKCWEQYVSTQVDSGAISIKCPEFKCNSVVDWPTIVSFIGPNMFKRHLNAVKNVTLSRDPSMIWCPVAGCGRIIVDEQSKPLIPVNVACQCGHTMCLRCKEECHWPSSCKQAQLYIEKLIKTGDMDKIKKNVELLVSYKKCPKCNYPVQKNGGCPHMHCVCGYDFCWKCGRHMWSQPHYSCYNTQSDGYKYQKVILKDEYQDLSTSSIRSKLYIQALRHRNARRQDFNEKYGSRVVTLAEKIKIDKASLEPKRESNLQHTTQIVSDLVAQIQRRKKLTDFLVSVVDTLKELHHVAEHTYIAIQGKSSQNLMACMDQLEFVVTQIQIVIADSPPKEVVTQLEYLIQHAEKILNQIARLTCPPKKSHLIPDSSSNEGFEIVNGNQTEC